MEPVQTIPNSPSKEAIAASKISGIPLDVPAEAPAPQSAADQPSVDVGGQPEGEPDQVTVESQTEDIEFDGIKFAVPKDHAQKVRDGFLREADYTRKTQEVSERARVVAEQEKLLQLNREFHQATVDDIATVKAYDQALQRYANVDWMSMQTDELMRTRLQYDQLKEARANAAQTINKKWADFNQKRDEHLKNLEKAGRDEASRRITGFDDKKADALKAYAKRAGYTDAEVSNMFFRGQDIEIIWKAMQFDSLPRDSIQQRVNKAPPVAKPGASTPAQKPGEKLQASFKQATGKNKEAIGGHILAQKMRMI